MTAWDPLFIILSLAASALGAWGGPYLGAKGKRYATSEDLNKILTELRATTRTTEDIKAAISNSVWLRQNAWTLRRDTYLGLLTSMSDGAFFLRQLDYLAQRPSQSQGEDLVAEYGLKLSASMEKLRGFTAAAGIVLPAEALYALESLNAGWIAADRHFPFSATHREIMYLILDTILTIQTRARADLGLDDSNAS